MAKRNHALTLIQNARGQISIFFSASLIVMVSIVAFVINIGLFVKAKINLQNATDAAAYAGAAVQARQLSKIAYLNWEMRNIYKEWMYKYYVIGNLNIPDVETPKPTGVMEFRLQNDVNVLTGDETTDRFNIPAVCIHIAGSQTNICKRYSVPGLPEFGSSNLLGAEQASRAFMDTLISTKVNDCVDRTRLNMAVATAWTYNVRGNSMGDSLVGVGPAIMTDRQGAWPKAVELAVRMRNLERVVNAPADRNPVCISGSGGITSCQKSITDVSGSGNLGSERIVKAFYSGFRNLGNDQDNEMKNSFTLTEIPPKTVKADNPNNASNYLIPTPYEKQYLDLKLMMVNYAIFYAAMIPRADSKTSGACDISKVAIPVPGYPLGFYKNPDVVTYYAVKGEAEFVGMFNPFMGSGNVVKMTAYSAAKPFGGRIGPMLFVQRENDEFLRARGDNQKYRSVPYINSYDFKGVTIRGKEYKDDSDFIPGLPLPTNSKMGGGSFWLELEKPVGGKLADASGIQFGVPNLPYDYSPDSPFMMNSYAIPSDKIHTVTAKTTGDANGSAKAVGLYSRYQFNRFRGSNISKTISPEALDREIARVRAPTSYEAANYLIPTPNDFNVGNRMDSYGFISSPQKFEELNDGYKRYRAMIYAPLYRNNDQNDVLYQSPQDVKAAIFEFMRAQITGMRKYRMALNTAAYTVYNSNPSPAAKDSVEGYQKAADGISDIDFKAFDPNAQPKSCKSIAGQFLYFFWGNLEPNEGPMDTAGCPVSLGSLIEEYFSSSTKDEAYNPTYYNFEFTWKADSKEDGLRFMSAYAPGPFTGMSRDATYVSPLGASDGDTMRRNTYSTKFVSLDSLQAGSETSYSNQFPIMSEGDVQPSGGDTAQNNFRNSLDAEAVGLDFSSIKY